MYSKFRTDGNTAEAANVLKLPPFIPHFQKETVPRLIK